MIEFNKNNFFIQKNDHDGMSLIEIIFGITILSLAFMGTMLLMRRAEMLSTVSSETAIASSAARRQIETMLGTTFADIYATYNESTADDPGGVGTAEGRNFAVRDLNVSSSDTDGFAGRIIFPEIVDGSGNRFLSETYSSTPLGMPRDLNGDQDAGDTDVATDYKFLPVIIRIEYDSNEGFYQTDDFYFMLNDRS